MVGKILGKMGGSRSLNPDVIKEWFYYFYQCTECRRCSLFCPYGIDTAEITMIVRELLHEVGLGIHWIMDPISNCNLMGNTSASNRTPSRKSSNFSARISKR
jgi:Fe-S oxidoreductase